jgi:nucleoside-diphosphate-sugar epimerase
VIARSPPGTFNLAAGKSHRVAEVISLVERHTGRAVPIRPQAAPPWDVHDSRLDIRRFTAATGWRPQVSLAEGIRRAAGGYTNG